MKERRKTESLRNLCNGPGKLCSAMGITKEHYGIDLCGNELYLIDCERPAPVIMTSPRINIDYAEEYVDVKWRYYAASNDTDR
jgi:DNA-3-methyladenine glycosylase